MVLVPVPDTQYEYSTHVEDDDGDDDDDDDDDDHVNGSSLINMVVIIIITIIILYMCRMMMTTMLMRILPLTVKILSIEMNLKTELNEGTLRGTLMTMRRWTILNPMQTMLLVSKTLQTQSLPTHLLLCHFLQILRKIWLILHILRYHLCLLGGRG